MYSATECNVLKETALHFYVTKQTEDAKVRKEGGLKMTMTRTTLKVHNHNNIVMYSFFMLASDKLTRSSAIAESSRYDKISDSGRLASPNCRLTLIMT